MPVRIPIKRHEPEEGLAEFESADFIGITSGGTGATTSSGARSNLGVARSAITLINGQPNLTIIDTTRANKIVSVSMVELFWAEATVSNNEWIGIAQAVDSDSGYVMPFDGVVVGITMHCENTNGNTKPIRMYRNTTDLGTIGDIPSGVNVSSVDTSLDFDFSQGDRIRLRGNGGGGSVQDMVISLWIRWRG